MVVCPNCTHQNPEGATQCEACYTPLPAMTSCPNCGASVQADAAFCGQCGNNLQPNKSAGASIPDPLPDIPDLVTPDPLINPDPLAGVPPTVVSQPLPVESNSVTTPSAPINQPAISVTPPPIPTPTPTPPPAVSATPIGTTSGTNRTQLQIQKAVVLHVQTNTKIELPQNLSVIHIGKPNDQIPPDIDVSGFPNSEIVSRIHADIRVEGDAFYIEDVGSANGTYINHVPLPSGNRHRLRPGDRISLGKGDLVTLLFQMS